MFQRSFLVHSCFYRALSRVTCFAVFVASSQCTSPPSSESVSDAALDSLKSDSTDSSFSEIDAQSNLDSMPTEIGPMPIDSGFDATASDGDSTVQTDGQPNLDATADVLADSSLTDSSVDGPVAPAPGSVNCTHTGQGTDYPVGPGQTYATIGAVPWESLAPGDTVRIFWKDTPYREKILIARSGTSTQPIRVCGVANAAGQRPVISGENATTRPQLASLFGAYQSYSLQQRGLVVIWGTSYGSHVEHIHVEGLQFEGTMHAPWQTSSVNSFVDHDGTTRSWDGAAAGIRAQRARNLVIRGNAFTKLNTGLYIISQPYNEHHMVRNVLVEGNVFWHNALVGDSDKHQAYIQGTNFIVQGNYFGSPTPNAAGNALKMRTSGDVIRYNYFENGARALDMVDIEDYVERVMPWQFARHRTSLSVSEAASAEVLQKSDWENYKQSFVYGNVFRIQGADAWPNPIHYGFDNSPYDRRPGTLWFYHNTLLYQVDFTRRSTVRLFDCCSDFADSFYGASMQLVGGVPHYVAAPPSGGSPVDWGPMLERVEGTFPRMVAHNNALVIQSFTANQPRSDFELTRWRADRLELGRNWITRGWNTQDRDQSNPRPGYGNSSIHASIVYPGGNDLPHVSGVTNLLEGDVVPIDLNTFAPVANGPLKNAAAALPSEIPTQHRPTFQVQISLAAQRVTVLTRPTTTTIGAIE